VAAGRGGRLQRPRRGAGEAAVRHGVRRPPRRDAGVDRRERLTSRRRLAAGSARDAAPPTTGQAVARGRAAPEEEKWMRVGLGRAGRCDSTRESKSSGHGPDPVAVPSPAHRASAELALGRPSRSWRRGERHSSRDGVRRLRGHARDVPAHRRQRPAWTFRLAMSALRRRGSSDRAMRGQRRVRVVRFSDGGAGGVACRDDRRDRPAVGCRSRSSNWSVIRGRARPSSCSISTARRACVPGRGVRRDGFVGDTWPPRLGGHRRARGRARAVRAVGP